MKSQITTQQLVTAMCMQKTQSFTQAHAHSVPGKQQPHNDPCLSQHTQAFSLWHSLTLSLLNIQTITHYTHTQAYLSSKTAWRQISLILYQPFFLFNSRRHRSLFCPRIASKISPFFWQTLTNSLS